MIPLKNNEIHLWFCYDGNIRDEKLIEQYHGILNESESYKQKKFYHEKNRHQYLLTRALLRTTLSKYTQDSVHPKDWIFKENKYGRPFVDNDAACPDISFNLSHTNGLIVLAISQEPILGVDTEWTLRDGKTVELADHYFSPSEAKELRQLPITEQDNRFYELWTLKEAYIKACGMGLSIPLDSFSYQFPRHHEIHITFSEERNDQPDLWQFWQMNAGPDYKVAIAVKTATPDTRYKLILKETVPFKGSSIATFTAYRSSQAKPLQLGFPPYS